MFAVWKFNRFEGCNSNKKQYICGLAFFNASLFRVKSNLSALTGDGLKNGRRCYD